VSNFCYDDRMAKRKPRITYEEQSEFIIPSFFLDERSLEKFLQFLQSRKVEFESPDCRCFEHRPREYDVLLKGRSLSLSQVEGDKLITEFKRSF
jgi:hypothetical protein